MKNESLVNLPAPPSGAIDIIKLHNVTAWKTHSDKVCKICGKQLKDGHIVFHGGEKLVFGVHQCKCYYERSEIIDLKGMIENADFPRDLLNIVLLKEKFDLSRVVKQVLKYEEDLDKNMNSKKGLFLIGDVGIGKTVSIIYLLLKIIQKYHKSVSYVSAEKIGACYKNYDYKIKKTYYYYRNKPILFVDDVNGSWNMHDFIEFRKTNGRLTFMASNCDYLELERQITEPVISRMKSNMMFEFLTGKDKRSIDFSENNPDKWKQGQWPIFEEGKKE